MPAGWVAAAGVVSGMLSSNASRSAASSQSDAQMYAAELQKKAVDQQRADLQPWTQAGSQSLSQIMAILNGKAGGATGTGSFDLTQIPGYQFGMQQGTQAVQGSAAAAGTQLSGNTLRDLQNFGQQYAGNQFQNYLGNLQQISVQGQSAAAGQAAASGAGATNIGNAITNAANANAAGIVGSTNSLTSGINSAYSNYQQQKTLSSLFNNNTSGYNTSSMPTENQVYL